MRVLASCDSKYFLDHHKAFYRSAVDCGYIPHINVINPTKEVLKTYVPNLRVTYGPDVKVFYAINRFLIADKYISDEGILITDIDCFFNKPMPRIEEDVGLFLREYESFPGMKVAAGIMWINRTPAAKEYITRVANNIKNRPQEWYVDQLAIYEEYINMKDKMSTFVFDNTHMDWEYNNDSYMWTGKGSRKYTNSTYLGKKKQLEELR